MSKPIPRRRFLAMAVGLGVAACARGAEQSMPASPSSSPPARPTPPPPSPSPSPSPSPTPEPTPSPVLPPLYEPGPEEVLPNAKRLAGRVAQTLATYEPGDTPEAVAMRALAGDLASRSATPLAETADLAAVIAPLIVPGARSIGEVIYPQLGGESANTCSVMVITRQALSVDGQPTTETARTLDVRLRIVGGRWSVESLESIGGQPVEPPADLSPIAAAVLADTRIWLPDSARWDIHARRIDDRLLTTMLQMADLAPYAVCTLQSGHPVHVFGQEHRSNHTVGRAVDVWKVGDAPVVTQQPQVTTAAYDMLRTLFDHTAVSELGGPWAFDGVGGRSFTDARVHKDHLHVAFGRA